MTVEAVIGIPFRYKKAGNVQFFTGKNAA